MIDVMDSWSFKPDLINWIDLNPTDHGHGLVDSMLMMIYIVNSSRPN